MKRFHRAVRATAGCYGCFAAGILKAAAIKEDAELLRTPLVRGPGAFAAIARTDVDRHRRHRADLARALRSLVRAPGYDGVSAPGLGVAARQRCSLWSPSS
jgi:hypothetical protein